MAKVDCKILSDKRCKDCSRKLKENLVKRNPKAERCFRCHIMAKEPQNRFKRLHIKVPAYAETVSMAPAAAIPRIKTSKRLAGVIR